MCYCCLYLGASLVLANGKNDISENVFVVLAELVTERRITIMKYLKVGIGPIFGKTQEAR